jgi:type VI secretion system protein ImpG
MSEPLLPYYERELAFFREMAGEFRRAYPGVADRLGLEPTRSTDPHVERLIQAFSLIAGRISHKLDDEFPELTEALLDVLYPHYLAPIPSMAVVQFDLDPFQADLPDGFLIDRHSRLRTNPVAGQPCQFRTCYPVTLWPILVGDAQLVGPPFEPRLAPPPGTKAVLTLRLESRAGLPFSSLSLSKLRFHLHGEGQLIPALYELLLNAVTRAQFHLGAGLPPIEVAPKQGILPVGFERDQGMLPYPSSSFLGYRLLSEFFAFPAKFLFFDLAGFDRVRAAGGGTEVEVIFYLKRTLKDLEQTVGPSTFRLGCSPIVNLFEKIAEPIRVTQARSEYRVEPDVAATDAMEVYSIDDVTAQGGEGEAPVVYHPFYSYRHGSDRDRLRAFWYSTRRPAVRKDATGTDVYLHLVNLDFNAHLPAESVLIVRTTCTNRDLPIFLSKAGERIRFELEAAAPLSGISCPRVPTPPLRPPLGRGTHWRLLAHLNLNHLSLTDSEEGRHALQEILAVYDFADPKNAPQLTAVNKQIIEGIQSVTSRLVVRRTGCPTASGFARGVAIRVELDRQKYVGVGTYLFACVLERFLALYASINSFTQLEAVTGESEEPFQWPPRAAEIPLI